MRVELSLAEKFLNWFPRNTKLYIRGERGKSYEEVSALWEELAGQLQEFFRGNVITSSEIKEILDDWNDGNPEPFTVKCTDIRDVELCEFAEWLKSESREF